MLNDIYLLLPQDVIDFNALNALPENNQGPQVSPMSYQNNNSYSSVKVNLTGTPNSEVPKTFMFSDTQENNIWELVLQVVNNITVPIVLDSNGDAFNVYAECKAIGEVTADAGTLTNIVMSPGDISSIANPFDAIVSGQLFDNCVDKSTIDDPTYQAWADAMEANQPISTREVITITISL